MRLKNVPGSREKISGSRYVMQFEPEYDTDEKYPEQDVAGRWHEIFANDNPVQVEIGMGKGLFLMRHAKAQPQINFIGIEKFSSVLVRALEKQEQEELDNVMLIRMDAENIESIFARGEVDKIYLNFSDPWPKERHAKRRLTSTAFLSRYENILKEGGEVVFKTDNTGLFDFSLEQIRQAGWELKYYTYDLHGEAGSPYLAANIMTEYEEKFTASGNKICMLIAGRP